MKIVFLGTSEFAIPSLESLYNKGYNIPLVITQVDRPKGRGKKVLSTPIKEKSIELGLDVYQPSSINACEAIDKLKEISPDCIVVASYGQILNNEVLNLPTFGCINIHGSILPKYRGAAPINWAIINGEVETGISIMLMDEGLDSGDILKVRSIPISELDDSITIHNKLSRLGGQLIVETLENLSSINKMPQNHDLATYAPKIHKETGRIDWNSFGDDIINLIRGLKPWPSAYVIYKNVRVKVHKARKIEKFTCEDNGVIVKVTNEGIYVNCSDWCIIIEELQFPGKNILKVSEYIKGNEIEINAKLL